MGKIRKIALAIATLLFSAHSANAWVRVVYDIKSTAAVGANTAFQKIIEDGHNARLDSIRSKQDYVLHCLHADHQGTLPNVDAERQWLR